MSSVANKTYNTIKLQKKGGILTLALNRPDKKNAMSFLMMRELIDVATALKKDSKTRAVIITGEGDTYCAGIDLSDLGDPKNRIMGLRELLKPTQSIFQRVCLIWRDVPVPVIVATHRYCIGAGMQLALAADIRIAEPDCQFSIMEAKWGLVPDMGLTQSAFHVVSADNLKELTMSARMVGASEAHKLGLITHIDDNPVERAQALAEEFALRSPDAVLAGKRVINRMTRQSPAALYKEKIWQLKLMVGKNRKLAIKKAKDSSIKFLNRQFN